MKILQRYFASEILRASAFVLIAFLALFAFFDLIPLAGATISGIIVVLVALATEGWVVALIFGIYFLVYQQLENHILQPLVYRRTVAMSPVVVLIAVLIGADLAGVIGALIAIPIAGSLQVIGNEALASRRERVAAPEPAGLDPP